MLIKAARALSAPWQAFVWKSLVTKKAQPPANSFTPVYRIRADHASLPHPSRQRRRPE